MLQQSENVFLRVVRSGSTFFVRVYKTHIVNLAYIHIIGDTWLSLYNVDEKIPLSRTYKNELIESYMNYKDKESL